MIEFARMSLRSEANLHDDSLVSPESNAPEPVLALDPLYQGLVQSLENDDLTPEDRKKTEEDKANREWHLKMAENPGALIDATWKTMMEG